MRFFVVKTLGSIWPVVQREMRASARHPVNHWLRVGGALGAGAVFCFVAQATPVTLIGGRLMEGVHLLILYLICLLIPGLAADCIAREKREGTLGLLFMTPLTASGIVLGKILSQVLRAFTLWLAIVPLLAIPFVYGGVTWADLGAFLIIEICAGMICLAAGLVASALTEKRAVAFILAYLFMACLVFQSGQSALWAMRSPARLLDGRWAGLASQQGRIYSYVTFIGINGVRQVVPRPPGWRGFGPGPGAVILKRPAAVALLFEFGVASLALWFAFVIAGYFVERSWHDKPPSLRQQNWRRRCGAPLFRHWHARRMSRALEKNPIAWLQQYSWKARATKWGLCLLFVALECACIDSGDPYGLSGVMAALLVILAAAYTYAGVNSFLREKQTGALELMLVTPLTINQIIGGRVWGLWKQFLPAVVVLVFSDAAVRIMIPQGGFGYFASRAEFGLLRFIETRTIE